MSLRRIVFLISLAVFLVVAAAGCSGSQEVQTADMAYNGGVVYLNKGDFQKAIDSFSKAIDMDPRYYRAYTGRALAYQQEGQNGKAIDDFSKAIDLAVEQDKARLYELRGSIYQQTGDVNKALADFNQAISRDPKSPASYLGRSLIYFHLDKLADAMQDAEQVIKLDSNNAEAYALLASIDEKQGNLDQAVKYLTTAISKKQLPAFYYARASLLYQQGKLAGASTDLETYFSLTQKTKDANQDQATELLKSIQSTQQPKK